MLDLCDFCHAPNSSGQVVSECFANEGVKAALAAMPGRRAFSKAGKKGAATAAGVKKLATSAAEPITSQKGCKACQGAHRKHTCGKDATGSPAVSPGKNTKMKLADWDAIKKQVAEQKGKQQTEASAGPGSMEVAKVHAAAGEQSPADVIVEKGPDTSVSDKVPAPSTVPPEPEPQADMMLAVLRRLCVVSNDLSDNW